MSQEMKDIASKYNCSLVVVINAKNLVEHLLVDAPWYFMYTDKREYDIKSKMDLIDQTVMNMILGKDPTDMLTQYRSAESFSDAKYRIVRFLSYWRDEINLSLKLAKRLKEPKKKKGSANEQRN